MTPIALRPYQQDGRRRIDEAWNHCDNVLYQLATGGGKTTIFAGILADNVGPSCAIAHRQELVGQIALALGRFAVPHRIIGPPAVVRAVVQAQYDEFGRAFYDPNAAVGVAGVDTLVRRGDSVRHWAQSCTLWVQDEAHHVLRANKWGRSTGLFPNARGLGVTATPGRADGRGLGRHSDGVFDRLISGPGAAELIADGYLTPYRVIGPPGDYVRPGEDAVGSSGDIKLADNLAAVRASHILGDIVRHYLEFTPGKRGVVFAVDIATATEIALNFKRAGVKAEVIHSGTPELIRRELVGRLRRGDLDTLVNVDIFGEGFDLPAIDVVIMARATESLALFLQQFGRGLRPVYAPGYDLSTRAGRLAAIAAGPKPYATIIDHVGNVARHLLPETPRRWSLDGRTRSKREPVDQIAVKTCLECFSVFERFHKACPYCGHVEEPTSRSAPQFVEGDLLELDEATLQRMRGEIARIDGAPRLPVSAGPLAVAGAKKQHALKQEAQSALRGSIAWWAAYQRNAGRSDSESYRRFFATFGVDVMSAQALGKADALQLAERVNLHLAEGYA
jgi:DNA repair protein RadD